MAQVAKMISMVYRLNCTKPFVILPCRMHVVCDVCSIYFKNGPKNEFLIGTIFFSLRCFSFDTESECLRGVRACKSFG